MRKIRDGLTALGFPAEDLMMHGTPRIIYGVQLIENLKNYLLGIDERPKYFLKKDADSKKEVQKNIIKWWLKRWVIRRISREDVIDKISKHTLVHPIQHGARVVLPRADLGQNLLFE